MALNGAKDEAQTIFSKYQPQNSFARRLKKPQALELFKTEFGLTDEEAEIMFQAYDKDHNEVLSLWEFRQFYQTIGSNGHYMIELFRSIEDGNSGKVDMDKAFEALRTVETGKGPLTEEEISNFLKTTAGEAKSIDLHQFLNLLCRLKVYKG